MVKALAIVLALTAVAHAEDDGDYDDGPPTLLGFRLDGGRLPIKDQAMTALGVGLDVDHPFARRWHAFGEYEYLWLARDGATMEHGNGHRVLAGLRASLVQHARHHMRSYVDLEGGGGMTLVTDSVLGARSLGTGFAGVRAGFDFEHDDSPSRVFETELVVRAVFVPGGTGVMAGLGMQWGN
jgi:hypothetical protein